MYSNHNRVKNLEIPENLFNNLGESKKFTSSIIIPNDMEKYNINPEQKLTNYSKKKEYRTRINKMYDDIDNLTPIDSEIDSVLYFNNYLEKGIVVKPKVSSLKQFWTEYRLINNERKSPRIIKKHQEQEKNKLDNFDKLFEALQIRVKEIDNYIDELKEMRLNIDESNIKLKNEKESLETDRRQLDKEKTSFLEFKQSEEAKIKNEKESLKKNYNRLQNIIDDLDKKLGEIEK